MSFYGGGGATVSTFGGSGGSNQVQTTIVPQTTSNGYVVNVPVSSPATNPQYGYLDNSGNYAQNPNPVSVVYQGYNVSAKAPNPTLAVDTSTGKILSGPGTGQYYNPTTNSPSLVPPFGSSDWWWIAAGVVIAAVFIVLIGVLR